MFNKKSEFTDIIISRYLLCTTKLTIQDTYVSFYFIKAIIQLSIKKSLLYLYISPT